MEKIYLCNPPLTISNIDGGIDRVYHTYDIALKVTNIRGRNFDTFQFDLDVQQILPMPVNEEGELVRYEVKYRRTETQTVANPMTEENVIAAAEAWILSKSLIVTGQYTLEEFSEYMASLNTPELEGEVDPE